MLDNDFIQNLFSHHLLPKISSKKLNKKLCVVDLHFKKSFVHFVFNTFIDSFQLRQGQCFNQISKARSALSSVIKQHQNVSYGNTPTVKRYMKGIFENKPTLPKFQFT